MKAGPLIVVALFLLVSVHLRAADYQTRITVAQDGSGDFTSIQAAVNATKTFPGEPITIHIKSGTYNEKVNVYSWNTHLSIIGESRENTIITHDDYFDKINKGRNSTFHTYTMRVAANDFSARNLTIINSSGPVGQAVALHVEGDRVEFENVSLKGFQDTLYIAGEGFRSYFRNCEIEGSVDFIFGGGTALFEDCYIKSVANGYITAASTPLSSEFGFVFKHCRVTAPSDVDEVYLGRPWRPNAKTVFMNTELSGPIMPAGWDNWRDPNNEKSAYFAEYSNSGPAANTAGRVAWSHQLSEQEAQRYTAKNILGGWQPNSQFEGAGFQKR